MLSAHHSAAQFIVSTLDDLGVCRLILETEPQMVASRVSMRGADGEVPLTEQVRV